MADLVVVGAGIVGLAHAVEAVRRGMRVVVLDRDDRAVGASIRNFGHGGVTVQAGESSAHARAARARWIELGRLAGFWVGETGAVVVARGGDERAVLEELAAERDGEIHLLDVAGVLRRAPVAPDAVHGGAHLLPDIRVDPREALPALARWLERQPGAEVRWGTTFLGAGGGVVRTSRGDIEAPMAVVCVGHDVDRAFPHVAEAAGVRRCALRMLRVAAPRGARFDPAVLTGSSMLRYPAFAGCPSIVALRERFERTEAASVAAGVNLMFTQRPDGDLVIGDTHRYGRTLDPFEDEDLDELLLAEVRELLGVERLVVRQRWRGVYASAPQDLLVATPASGVRVVSVTSGIGMTTALGLAPGVLDDLAATGR